MIGDVFNNSASSFGRPTNKPRVRPINLSAIRGDTFVQGVRINRNGTPVKMVSGDTVRFYLFSNTDGGEPLIQKVFTAENQVNDVLVVTLEANDTESLSAGRYPYELEITFADGVVRTPMRGDFRIEPDLITPEVRE